MQLDDYLQRYGHPGIKVADPALAKLIALLKSQALSKSTQELNLDVSGKEVFDSNAQIPGSIRADIILDGARVGERNPQIYLEDAQAKRAFDHYHSVRQQALDRRQTLRQSVASTTRQLRGAQTESETRKLAATLTGLQTELAAIDQEIGFATSEVVTRQLQVEASRRLHAKAQMEDDRARHLEASRKDAEFYRLLTAPTFFNVRK